MAFDCQAEVWGQQVEPACCTLMDNFGRDWQSLGWPGDSYQLYKRVRKDIKKTGDFIVCRGVDLMTALRMVKALQSNTKLGADFVEDYSLQNEPKDGDKVKLATTTSEDYRCMKKGEIGTVISVCHYREQSMYVQMPEDSQVPGGCDFYREDEGALPSGSWRFSIGVVLRGAHLHHTDPRRPHPPPHLPFGEPESC